METTQIILIVVIAVLLIAYPVIMVFKNKKENQKMQEQTNSIKRGDRVLTTSGIYGTVVDLQLEDERKVVVLETGSEKKKGYLSIDAYAIYKVFKDETEQAPQEKKDEKPQQIEEKQETSNEQNNQTEVEQADKPSEAVSTESNEENK